jgi:hypothetical protein
VIAPSRVAATGPAPYTQLHRSRQHLVIGCAVLECGDSSPLVQTRCCRTPAARRPDVHITLVTCQAFLHKAAASCRFAAVWTSVQAATSRRTPEGDCPVQRPAIRHGTGHIRSRNWRHAAFFELPSAESGTRRNANLGHPGRQAAPLRQQSRRQSGDQSPHQNEAASPQDPRFVAASNFYGRAKARPNRFSTVYCLLSPVSCSTNALQGAVAP